jgi:protein phosphatase
MASPRPPQYTAASVGHQIKGSILRSNWKQLSPSVAFELALGRAFGVTDVGAVRESNQDNFFIAPATGLVMVADGMGGHEAGEVASTDAILSVYDFIRTAVQDLRAAARDDGPPTAPRSFDPHLLDPDTAWKDPTTRALITLQDAIAFANERLYLTNSDRGHPNGSGMGTTLTGLWQVDGSGPLYVFHIGDSRLYCYRDGQLQQLTRDQTLYQQALDAGLPEPLPPRNLLTQALGPSPEVWPELRIHAPAPGDLYLLCSDGLYGDAAPGAIEAILADATLDNLGASCARLVDMAKRDGGRDNITAVLVACR